MAPIGCESQGVIVRSWVAYSGRDSPRGASSGRADGRRPPRRRFARDHVSRSALRRCARKWPRPFPLAHRAASGGLGAAQGTVRDSSAFRTNRLAGRSLPALWHRCLRYRHRGTIARDGSTNPPSEGPLKVAATRACGGHALSFLKVVTTPNAFFRDISVPRRGGATPGDAWLCARISVPAPPCTASRNRGHRHSHCCQRTQRTGAMQRR